MHRSPKYPVSKHVLIYRLGSLGDTVIALPCFNFIKLRYPNAQINLLTNKPVAAVAAPLEAVLGTEAFHRHVLSYPAATRNPLILARLARDIARLKIDTVINITAYRSKTADRRDKLFFSAIGISNLIGFDIKSENYRPKRDPKTGEEEWEAIRLKKRIAELGDFSLDDPAYWNLHLTLDELSKAKKLLVGFPDINQFIAINVGTKMPIKDWGEANWLALMTLLRNSAYDGAIVAIGVAEESAFAEACLSVWGGPALNLCGKSNPRVSAAVLANAQLFVGHDSGPMHLAACVGVPCVGIFSCINKPKRWFPRGQHNTLLFPNQICAPQGRACELEERCVLKISPDRVFEAIVEQLAQKVKV